MPAVAALNRYAGAQGIPLISTVDAHTENDPEFQIYPPHCVAGTAGQHKPASTLLEKRATLPNVPVAALPEASPDRAGKTIGRLFYQRQPRGVAQALGGAALRGLRRGH